MRDAQQTCLAVSLCNTPGSPFPLVLIVDTKSLGISSVLDADESLSSACGLAADERHLYVACSGKGGISTLVVLDKATFAELERVPLDFVIDVHSICLDGGRIIAASTGTDEIVRFSTDSLERHETLWRAADGKTDTHHVNSVAWTSERLLCSAFGPKSGERWFTARNGYVHDITRGERVLSGLYHPHSISTLDGQIYVCESSAATVRGTGDFRAAIDGYARGLAFADDGTAYVGSSIGRLAPELPDEVLNPADPGELSGRCAITTLNGQTSVVDLSPYAREIYDVLCI